MTDAPKGAMSDSQISKVPSSVPEQTLSDPVAMAGGVGAGSTEPKPPQSSDGTQPAPTDAISSNNPDSESRPESSPDKGKDLAPPSPPAKNDEDESVIAATSDDVPKAASGDEGPVCVITLLVSSGKKHPYKIDEKYLAKRGVEVPGTTETGHKDPFTISVYSLKELILREWREEWEPRPSSPTSIRLIHFGKLLADKDQLNQYKFSAETSNVVHMSVRPMEIIEEDEPKGGSKSTREGRRGDDANRCCVIL